MDQECKCPYFNMYQKEEGGTAEPLCMAPDGECCGYPWYCPIKDGSNSEEDS